MGEITPSNKERTTNNTDLHYLTSLFSRPCLHRHTYIYYPILYMEFNIIEWLCLKPPKIKDQNSGSQFMLGGPLPD